MDLGGLTERAVFWAELGLITNPAVLARLGHVLRMCAAEDRELEAAMHLAAAHVRRECLVWGSPYADAVKLAVSPAPRCEGSQSEVSPASRCRPAAAAPPAEATKHLEQGSYFAVRQEQPSPPESACSSPWPESSEGSRSDGEMVRLPTLRQHFALPAALLYLPGLGAGRCQRAYVAAAVCAGLYNLCFSLVSALPAFGGGAVQEEAPLFAHLSPWVTSLASVVLGLQALACIPIWRGIRRLLDSEVLQSVEGRVTMLHVAEQRSTSLRACVFGATIFAILVTMDVSSTLFFMFKQGSSASCGQSCKFFRIVELATCLVYDLHTAVFFGVFVCLWEITWYGSDRFCRRMQQGIDDWAALTREYHAWHHLVGKVWGAETFGTAVVSALACCFIGMLWGLFVGVATTSRAALVVKFTYAAVDATCLALLFGMMATVASKCWSKRRSKESMVLCAALQYSRVLPRQCAEHELFLQCVSRMPCCVELPLLGTITPIFALNVTRFCMATIPVCFSFALHIAVSAERA